MVERNQLVLVLTVHVLVLFSGKGECDSTCPDGITNITATSGVLEYPESGDYGINETKCWKIEVPETYGGIYYTRDRLDIEVCDRYECDFLAVSNSYNLLKRAAGTCGRNSAEYYKYLRRVGKPGGDDFTATTMYVRFVSDETVHRKGFKFSFIAYSSKGALASYLNASEDETIEFGTPKVGIQKYPESYAEQWFLIVPEGRQVQIDFDTFELEDSKDCKNDYVEFREASIQIDDPSDIEGYRGPFLTKRLCGSTKPSSIQSKGNIVWVQFKSDSNSTTVYKGFKASFKAGKTGLFISNLVLVSALLLINSLL